MSIRPNLHDLPEQVSNYVLRIKTDSGAIRRLLYSLDMAYAGIGRFLFKEAPLILTGLYAAYSDLERHDVASDFQARRCQVVQYRPAPDDVCVNTFDFVNITSGELDTSWTSADFSGVEARLRTFYAAISANLPAGGGLREFRWSVLPNPPGIENPALRVAPPATALTWGGSFIAPPQLAMSLTKTTAVRRHWGRIYIGPLSTSAYSASTGRFGSTLVDSVANAFNTLRGGLQADDTPMIVYDRARNVGLSVDGVRVDDIVDVVRSRRFRSATYRKIL
jgi:hypothetical protein